MKKATAHILELAESFGIKYAAMDMRCKCELAKCQEMGAHSPAHCKNKATTKGCLYLGPVCDECAMFLDPQHLIDLPKF
jgi:hypothetical protein